jgi:hypothetical protein
MIDDNSERAAKRIREYSVSAHPTLTGGAIPAHLAHIQGTDWAFWRWVVLRGAGFPAEQSLKLSAPDCADIAEKLIKAEEEVIGAQEALSEILHSRLKTVSKESLPMWSRALRQIKKGKHPDLPVADKDVANRLAELQDLRARVVNNGQGFQRAYQEAIEQGSASIRSMGGSARFREAVIWQNRNGLHASIDSLLRMSDVGHDSPRGSDRRRREDLVANYLQRYCLKNDTIGFFGPVGWARFSTSGPSLSVRPGPQLLAERAVYLETWGIDALAARLSRDARFQPWIAPRRMPFARIEGARLFGLPRGPVGLAPAEVAVWGLVDGVRTAREVVASARNDADGQWSEADLYEALRLLEQKGALSWQLEACLDLYPERSLRRQLELIGEEALRREGIGLLEELEAGRERVAAAAGEPERLDAALGELEDVFKRVSGQEEATRAAGRTYAGRTLVFEDCRRWAEVDLGPEVVEELGRPLSLLLESARWFTYEVSKVYRRAFGEVYEEISRREGRAEVEFAEFWQTVRPLIVDREASLVRPVSERFEEKWEEVLRLSEGEEGGRRVVYRSEDLRERVGAAFSAPGAGWQFARYHNPDVMITAKSVEAAQAGHYSFVMGEIHIGSNSIGVPLFMEQHPRKEDLLAAIESDMTEPRLMPIMPKYWPNANARLAYALMTTRDYRLELAPGPYQIPPDRLVPSGELLIKRDDSGALRAQTRDGRVSFDIIEAFAIIINSEVANNFRPLRAWRHAPRVQIDRLVIGRETWRFSPAEMWFAFETEGAAQYLEAQRWRLAHDAPQHVFVKAPVEMKPFYVDLTSPAYVRNLGKVVRRCVDEGDVVAVTEMLPGPEEVWLPDAEGNRYTSELRMTAVDLAAHSPAISKSSSSNNL